MDAKKLTIIGVHLTNKIIEGLNELKHKDYFEGNEEEMLCAITYFAPTQVLNSILDDIDTSRIPELTVVSMNKITEIQDELNEVLKRLKDKDILGLDNIEYAVNDKDIMAEYVIKDPDNDDLA